jgi:hypothetical protein
MEQAKLIAINRCIQDAVQQAVDIAGISVPAIEGFLRTGEETWGGAGSGRFAAKRFPAPPGLAIARRGSRLPRK